MDMIGEDMETDPVLELSSKEKAERLHALAIGPLASSVAKLSGSSRGFPTDKDFHFFNNFDEFKLPVKEIAEKSRAMLESIGSSRRLWGKEMIFPKDLDEGYDWLVNVNDEVFERFDVSVDEFQGVRKKEEESGRRVSSIDSESGFQLVYGKKKKSSSGVAEKVKGEVQDSTSAVKMALRDKRTTGSRPRVPFHLPTIPRPQDEFKILVNNSNYPFEHVWLRRSEDGSRFIHPLEELSELDFVDRSIGDVEPVKPLPVEITPFKLVQEVKDLKELAAKLRTVNEIAVDLEHNQYRSFQGLTCLMQISTRAEDFVVDTLKLRVHIGPYLREIFKDPSKKKVMHGADRDIMWLQRDFGIYVCNLFDTGQASKVLKLERNSLEYLLYYFCDVTANKEYQNADWRLRPLPDEMIRYAREDTHYLLYIYDLMRSRLLSESSESESAGDLLLEVYKRSYDVCMQLYEKELLTDSSYLHIYGLQASGFNAQQLAIVAGLCEWRDIVAREEDESTGYILPNKALLEIARQMPVTTSKLRRLLRSKHPYVEQNLGSVVNIIKHAIENSSAFEVAAEQLNKGHIEMEFEENTVVNNGTEAGTPEATTEIDTPSAVSEDIGDGNSESSKITENHAASVIVKDEPLELGNHTVECGVYGQRVSLEQPIEAGNMKNELDGCTSELPKQMLATSGRMGETMADKSLPSLAKPVARASVQLLKKPSTFGALLGNSALQRRPGLDQKENTGKRMEQIKSSENLPFNLFFSGYKQTESTGHTKFSAIPDTKESSSQSAAITKSEEIRPLESDLQNGESSDCNLDVAGDGSRIRDNVNSEEFGLEMDEGNELMSISDLTSSFQKCIKSTTQTKKSKQVEGSQESDGFLQVKPFDYAAAKKELNFGERLTERDGGLRGAPNSDSRERRKSSTNGRAQIDEERRDLPLGRRRQAFPATGNRSATFR